MITILKCLLTAGMVISSLLVEIYFYKAGVAVLCLLMYSKTRSSIKTVIRSNYVIMFFACVFTFFTLFSGYLKGKPDIETAFYTFLKIILVFNVINAGYRWVGKRGILVLLDILPVWRMKVYLLLLIKTLAVIFKTIPESITQVSLRLHPSSYRKIIIARYYVQNIIYKELYTVQHIQTAAHLRITNKKIDVTYDETMEPADFVLVVICAGLLSAGLLL